MQSGQVHRRDCADKIREGAETLCGIKTIRQELYQMNGVNPFMQDCVVSEWMPGECSAECAPPEFAVKARAFQGSCATASAGASICCVRS